MPKTTTRRRASCLPIVWSLASLLLFALGLGGCSLMMAGKTDSPPSEAAEVLETPPAQRHRAPAHLEAAPQRYAQVNRDLANRLREASKNCAKVAKAMEAWQRGEGKDYPAVLKDLDAWEARTGRYEVQGYYDSIFHDIIVRVDAGRRCEKNRRAKAAYERFYEMVGVVVLR